MGIRFHNISGFDGEDAEAQTNLTRDEFLEHVARRIAKHHGIVGAVPEHGDLIFRMPEGDSYRIIDDTGQFERYDGELPPVLV